MNDDNIENVIFYFKQEVGNAVRNNDRIIINKIMLSENYPQLNKLEKEELILDSALLFFANRTIPIAVKFMQYLIFEYGISEDIYVKVSKNNGPVLINEFFNTRRLSEQLGQELPINKTESKKIKV